MPIIADIFRHRTLDEMTALCDRAAVPFAPMACPGDLYEDPQLNTRGRMMNVAAEGRVRCEAAAHSDRGSSALTKRGVVGT